MSKNLMGNYTKDYNVMDVNDMLKKLSRYPMEERLGIMFNNSMKFINNSYSVVSTNEKNEVQPWEMDTFLLLCLMANNNTTPNTFNSKQGKREVYNILSNIRMEMECWDDFPKEHLVDVLLPAIANQQFPIQNYNFFYSTYRYLFIFNYNEKLKQEFLKKYQVEYEEIVIVFYLIGIIIAMDKYSPQIIQYIFQEKFLLCNNFSIELETLIEKQKLLTPNPEKYKYGLKLFNSYPFIIYNDIYYLPLPHTLMSACTDSLLIRLTSENERNDELRKTFGEAFEKYLYKIIDDSKIYDKVIPETLYYKNKRPIKSSDVIFTDNEHIVFVDAKLSQTSSKVKNIDLESIKKVASQYAEGVVQLYKRMIEYPKTFNPFEFECEENKKFGILACLEDSNIIRHQIYDIAFEMLKIEKGSETANFIKSNIAICGVSELEKLIFNGQSIIPHLEYRRNNHSYTDYPLINGDIQDKQGYKKSLKIKEFKDLLTTSIEPYVSDLIKKGYIKI